MLMTWLRFDQAKSVRVLVAQVGGPDKLNCLVRDYRNYVESVRRLNLHARDVDRITRIFLRMQQKTSDYFHLIHTEKEGRLDRVFGCIHEVEPLIKSLMSG